MQTSIHSVPVLRCGFSWQLILALCISFQFWGVTSALQHSQMRSRSLAFQQMFAVKRKSAFSDSSSISHFIQTPGTFMTSRKVFTAQTSRLSMRIDLITDSYRLSSFLYPRLGCRRFRPIDVRADRSLRSSSVSGASDDSDSQARAALSALNRRQIQDLAKKHGLRLACTQITMSIVTRLPHWTADAPPNPPPRPLPPPSPTQCSVRAAMGHAPAQQGPLSQERSR